MRITSIIIASLYLIISPLIVFVYTAFAESEDFLSKYQDEVRKNPDSAEAHLNLGKAYVDLKDWQSATKNFQMVILMAPNDSRAHNNLGFTYFNLNRYDEAVAEYKEAIRLDPANTKAHKNLAWLYTSQNLWQESIAEYKTVLRLFHDDAESHKLLGLAYEKLGLKSEAVGELKEIIRLDPQDFKAHLKLGEIYEGLGQRENAIIALKKISQLSLKMKELSAAYIEFKVKAHLMLGDIFYGLGQWENAAIEYQKSTDYAPATAITLLKMAKTSLHLERWLVAWVQFDEAYHLDHNVMREIKFEAEQLLYIAGAVLAVVFLLIIFAVKAIQSAHDFKNNQSSAYRPDIDGLRAVAVLSVVAFHAKWQWIPGGFVGVDIFFVISGYLISGILFKNLKAGSFSFFDFYSRRIRRIFPALIAALFTVWGISWFILLADEYKSLGKHMFSSAVFLQNFILWREAGYFDTASDLKPLLHIWSLGVEEQYYIIWPLLLYICWKRKVNALFLLCLVASSSFILNILQIKNHAIAAFFLPHTRFWELMSGGALAYVETFNGQHRVGGEIAPPSSHTTVRTVPYTAVQVVH